MALRWMREVKLVGASNLGIPTLLKMYNLFLQKCVGYSYVSQLSSTGSYNTTEKNGANGVFAGTDKVFTDATAALFVVGDIGKWILIVDGTNSVNNGWYKITGYTDASNVTIDFRSGATEYPTSASGLTWYLMAEAYDVSTTLSDYVRIKTPHADGWDLEMKYVNGSTNAKIELNVSLNAIWGTGQKLLGAIRYNLGGAGDAANDHNYMIANTDGTFAYFFQFPGAGGSMMSGIARIDPEFETGHAAIEKWALQGAYVTTSNDSEKLLVRTGPDWFAPYVWRESKQAQQTARLLEICNSNYDSGLVTWTSREQNARISKNDIMPGQVMILDWDNSADLYEILGYMKGTYQVRANLSIRQTLNHDGTKDLIHLYSGIAIDWPGITPQW